MKNALVVCVLAAAVASSGCMNEQAKISADAAAKHATALAAEQPENKRAKALALLAPAVADSLGAPRTQNAMTIPAAGEPVDAGDVTAAGDQARRTRRETSMRNAIVGFAKTAGSWILDALKNVGGPMGAVIGFGVAAFAWLRKMRESKISQSLIDGIGRVIERQPSEQLSAEIRGTLADAQAKAGTLAAVRKRLGK